MEKIAEKFRLEYSIFYQIIASSRDQTSINMTIRFELLMTGQLIRQVKLTDKNYYIME